MYRSLSCIVHKFYLCQVSLSFNFRMGRSTVRTIIKEAYEAVSRVLAKDFVLLTGRESAESSREVELP